MDRRLNEARGIGQTGRTLIVAAFASFLIANLIHNRFRVDAAIVPSTVFVILLLWQPRRWVLLAAAFLIAVPSALFFKVAAVTNLANTVHFLNHLFLLLAALLAIGAAVATLVPVRAKGPSPQS